ncbi:Protein MKS1 [Apostasia shenzhenica]|uniref:Protein MKS1 n=1 Tax=Apostasia shenzhenica TaxID=1088818 RepID=A0A2I0A820_9ASPA|nr:Protein MKS1 [Apostasia shenzhenica]
MDLFDQTKERTAAPPSSSLRRGINLQGPRPASLRVGKDSHKVKKPELPPQPSQRRTPVIIYTVSPKVIHTKPSEFMSLVQRLTGCSSSSSSSGWESKGAVSNNGKAAECAGKEEDSEELRQLLIDGGASQAASQSFFSQLATPELNPLNFFHHELNPSLHGGKGLVDNSFAAGHGNFFFSL